MLFYYLHVYVGISIIYYFVNSRRSSSKHDYVSSVSLCVFICAFLWFSSSALFSMHSQGGFSSHSGVSRAHVHVMVPDNNTHTCVRYSGV